MLSFYRRTRLSTRLIALGLIEALIFGVVFRNYPIENLLPALGITAGVLFIFDSAVRRGSTVLSAVIALGQIIIGTYGAVSINAAVTSVSASQGDFIFLFLQAFVFFALSAHAAWAIYWANGRIWLNLLVASLLLDFGFVALAGFGILPLIWATPAAFGISLVYLALRTIRFRKQAKFEAPARSKSTLGALRTELESNSLTVAPGTGAVDFFAFNDRVVLAVSAIEAKDSVKVAPEGLTADGKDVTELLAQTAVSATRAAHRTHLPRRVVYPVIFTRKAGLNPALRSIRVRSRKAPDRSLGTVYLVNPKGLSRLLKGTSSFKPLSKRNAKRAQTLTS